MAQKMPEDSGPEVGYTERDPKEEEKGVVERDLIGQFRSERDIYDQLLLHCKLIINPQC